MPECPGCKQPARIQQLRSSHAGRCSSGPATQRGSAALTRFRGYRTRIGCLPGPLTSAASTSAAVCIMNGLSSCYCQHQTKVLFNVSCRNTKNIHLPDLLKKPHASHMQFRVASVPRIACVSRSLGDPMPLACQHRIRSESAVARFWTAAPIRSSDFRDGHAVFSQSQMLKRQCLSWPNHSRDGLVRANCSQLQPGLHQELGIR